MRKSTMVELVEELQKLPQTPEILEMIAEAKAGEYHDYKNQKYVCGKMESATRLEALGHHELAARIKDGEFDEEADEEDKKMLNGLIGELAKGISKKKQDHELMQKAMQEMPRIRGKVGVGEDGKYYYEMSMWNQEATKCWGSFGPVGPFVSEPEAQVELRKASMYAFDEMKKKLGINSDLIVPVDLKQH